MDIEHFNHERRIKNPYICVDEINKEFLPPLEDLRSTGTTLAQRIKNYKSNLQALETPIMDQIQGTVDTIKRIDDVIFGELLQSDKSSNMAASPQDITGSLNHFMLHKMREHKKDELL